jgi:serine/threonine protein kinase
MPEAVQSGAGSDVPPQLVADHELLRRIGVGAYGEVWLARSVTGVYRAVKVLRRDRFEHDRIYEREFTGLKRFEPISRLHPGLIDVLQVGRDDQAGYFYYVMELADPADSAPGGGEILPESYVPLTLREMVARQGRLPVDECARIGAAMSDARSFVGTDGYIPPEGPGAAPADLYSLGKVLYEMATGRSRLDFPDLPREMLETVDAAAFAELNEIILRACAPEVAGRHRTAAELRGELL